MYDSDYNDYVGKYFQKKKQSIDNQQKMTIG